ncbi:MAG: exo-alpha-sialidase [Bacteroidales bacterium]|nr:exo-alpha-sialidase [Bacteroidales bacterium]
MVWNYQLMLAGTVLSLLAASCTHDNSSGGKETSGTAVVHRIEEIAPYTAVDSHAGEEKWSVLQPMYTTFSVVPNSLLTAAISDETSDQKQAYYARVKVMADGRYLLLYMGGQYGSRCFATTSSDFKNWSTPQMLLEPEKVQIAGTSDWRRYSGPDAVVLPDGDILAVFSFRETDSYSKGLGGGLVTMRSSDNGATWSAPQCIYEGTNWEPYLLVLPDGRLHCYFTDATPMTRNSGTSVLVSSDNGKTWSAKMRCARLYKYNYDGPNTAYTGQKIFTDQMPSFRVLNDGKTIFGFLEARLETPASNQGSSYYKMSLVYSDGLDWKDLGEETAGPERRQSTVIAGAGGYVSTFPSGEVVISCNISKQLSLKVGDRTATDFGKWDSGWQVPFTGNGVWGSTEVEDGNKLLAAIQNSGQGVNLGKLWLNHSLTARQATVAVGGNGKEWGLDEALYISTKDGHEVMVRAARDADNLYLCLDRRGDADLQLVVAAADGGATYKAALSRDGAFTFGNAAWTGKASTVKTSDGKKGTVAEVCIPLASLDAASAPAVMLFASLAGTPFTGAYISNPDSWQRILLP